MPWLINAAQADKFRKSQKSLIFLDASFHMDGRDGKKEYIEKHIVGAQFFDIDLFSDPNNPLPHTLIKDEKLIGEKLASLGIRNDFKIIIYDNSDLHSSARALWMLKTVGHSPHLLYILNGGLKAWEKYGGKVESGIPNFSAKNYTAKFQPNYYRDLSQMKDALTHNYEQIVDVRHPARFAGAPEPRPGLRAGHIPGSHSFPFSTFFDKDGQFHPIEKLRKLMLSVAIDPKAPTIATCGSGVTAPILDFILDIMDNNHHAVYDGSWTEWGSEKLYPGEKSLGERPVENCVDDDYPKKIE